MAADINNKREYIYDIYIYIISYINKILKHGNVVVRLFIFA